MSDNKTTTVAEDVAAFLAKGGKITQCEPGKVDPNLSLSNDKGAGGKVSLEDSKKAAAKAAKMKDVK